MGLWAKLAGTTADLFGLGKKSTVAVGIDASNNLTLRDEVVSYVVPLSDLVFTPTIVPSSRSVRVPSTFQYIVHQNLTIEGDLILDGELVIM